MNHPTLLAPDHSQSDALLRAASSALIAGDLKRRLERHNEVEEAEVHPWAGELLDRPEQVALNIKIVSELENLPPRFETK